jgi:hypothetical protein
MTRAYKFLMSGAVGRFSGFRWPAGEWVTSDGSPETCREGIHACRIKDLPLWLDAELWEVELGGKVVEAETKVVAPEGRLLRQVEEWNAETARDFARACALRAREHALQASRTSRLVERRLARASTPNAIRRAGERLASKGRDERSRLAGGYVADAGKHASAGAPAVTAYVAAHAAGHLTGPDAMAAERAWQANWLASRLRLLS